MKKLIATLTAVSTLFVLAVAILLILFPQQWKQTVYPSIAQLLPEPIGFILPKSDVKMSTCDKLEANLQSFANYLNINPDIVDIKGMNSLDDQLARIQARIDAMPHNVRNIVCQQETAKLEGLKSVFSLGVNPQNAFE